MSDFPGIRRAERTLALALVLFGSVATLPAVANDSDTGWLDGVYSGELGTRFWYGWGSTGKDLYGADRSTMVSRLTYKALTGATGEVYGQINEKNYFVKGFAGLGSLMRGTLQDEDFVTADFSPYSSTDSSLSGGKIGYFAVDGGGYFFQKGDARLGVFGGYAYLRQDVNGFGCTQTAGNPDVCTPSISDSVNVISQSNNWNAVRVGVNGDVTFGQGWRLKGEAAVLPYVKFDGTDSHWLRICDSTGCFTGGLPEDGTGWGYQLEASLDYTLANHVTVGVGGRYWHMQASGSTHFEGRVVGYNTVAQPVDWKTDYYGLTAHAGWQF